MDAIYELTDCIILTAILGVLATMIPKRLRGYLRRLEQMLSRLARHRTLCWIGAGLLVLIVRAALLPVWPIPKPVIYDEFSYILQADTFAHGRLTNPPHPFWQFFESLYILQQPTYASRFPPAQALVMALGQLVFGHPWFGVWLSAGVLASVLCWALQGWLPPGWALFGSIISMSLCLFSYWMNSYWGGAMAAIGGALVIGAWVRITRAKRLGYAWPLGIGAIIIILARPFEGLVFLVPTLIALALANQSLRVWLPILLAGAFGASWLAYDNYRVTGKPLRLPYQEYFEQYEKVPPFSVIPLATTPRRPFDLEARERNTYHRVRSWRLLIDRPLDWLILLRAYYGNLIWLFPVIAALPLLWRSKRTRLPTILAVCIGAASIIEVWWYPHYAAAFAAVFLILAVQAMRYLCQCDYHGREIGQVLVRAMPIAFLVLLITTQSKAILTNQTADQIAAANSTKDRIEQTLLERDPSSHVIFVRYEGLPSPHAELIYNPADIDSARVIWALDRGEVENEQLLRYYKGRTFWLFHPAAGSQIIPYQPNS